MHTDAPARPSHPRNRTGHSSTGSRLARPFRWPLALVIARSISMSARASSSVGYYKIVVDASSSPLDEEPFPFFTYTPSNSVSYVYWWPDKHQYFLTFGGPSFNGPGGRNSLAFYLIFDSVDPALE